MSVLAAFDTAPQALQFLAHILECAVDTPGMGDLAAQAAVFDIDDTMLFSQNGDDKVNEAIKLFWEMCGSLGMKRYIVTARPHMKLYGSVTNESNTVQELLEHGITDWDGLFLMPYSEYQACQGNAGPYKERVRRKIMSQYNDGKPALVTVGDQWGDMCADTAQLKKQHPSNQVLVGFFDDTAVLGIKLPN